MLALAKPGGRAHAHLTQLLAALEKEGRGVAAAAASAAVLAQGEEPGQGPRQGAGVEALLGGTKYEAVSSFGWDQVCGGSFVGCETITWYGGVDGRVLMTALPRYQTHNPHNRESTTVPGSRST